MLRYVPVVRIGPVTKCPGADTLSITAVDGKTVVFGTGDFREGDLAIYVPPGFVVPRPVPGSEGLGNHRRVKVRNLRGIHSEGLLLPFTVGGQPAYAEQWVGMNMTHILCIHQPVAKIPRAPRPQRQRAPRKLGLWKIFVRWCFRKQLRLIRQQGTTGLY